MNLVFISYLILNQVLLFMSNNKDKIRQGLSFDDVLIMPAKSDVLPNQVDLKTQFTKGIKLKIPLISAAMDTVTDSNMAIALAISGGIGVIHRNFSKEEQAKQVNRVKQFNVSSEFAKNAALDDSGRLVVAAAIGTSDEDLLRAKKLIAENIDAIIIDTAHAHSYKVVNTIKQVKSLLGKISLIVGNIATKEAAYDLINQGVDAVKVGIGPGAICTTRIVAGIGVPQFSAIQDVAEICHSSNIPLIADGGIKNSGDVAKAIAAGADSVMIGSLFAGTDESPGEIITLNGKKYKQYRGMGSLGAMQSGSSERYFQSDKIENNKFVPEGVEGYINYKASVQNVIYQLLGGLRSSMGYTGSKNINAMKKNCQFITMTASGLRESHVHDLNFFKNAPNYQNK